MFACFQKKSQASRVAPFVSFYFEERSKLKTARKAYRRASAIQVKLERNGSYKSFKARQESNKFEMVYRMAVIRLEEARTALLYAEEKCHKVH
jgi:hypothetical protein